MALIEKNKILGDHSSARSVLASQLLDEFVSAERRFIQRDWEPAQLDGGQFCEVSARIVYHIDSGNLNLNKEFDFAPNMRRRTKTSTPSSHDAMHIARVLRTIYKFRPFTYLQVIRQITWTRSL